MGTSPTAEPAWRDSGGVPSVVRVETEAVAKVAPSPDEFVTKSELTEVLEAVKKMESRVFTRLGNQALASAKERRAAEVAGGSDEPWRAYRPITGAGRAPPEPCGGADGLDELDAAEDPTASRRARPHASDGGGRRREHTPEGDLDLPCGRGVKKKRWHLAPKCFPHRETGQTKMCDGCDLPLPRNSLSASCPRCTSRYHQECLKFFSNENELLWQEPRCRKCHEALEDALVGDVVKTPAVKSLALADGMLGGANYLEPDAIRRNLLETQPAVRLNMIATRLESRMAKPAEDFPDPGAGLVTRAFTQAPPPPGMGPMSCTSFANWQTSPVPQAMDHVNVPFAGSPTFPSPPSQPSVGV